MWEEIAVKIALKAVEGFFDGIGKQDTDVISIGFAAGGPAKKLDFRDRS